MNKIKVCHVISGYYRTDARVFLRQCKSLYSNNFEVTILTNDGKGDEKIDDINFFDCDLNYNSRFKILLNAKKQFISKAIIINADIYQLHSPELLPLGRKLKKLGKKVIYDAHEDLPRHILEKEWIPKIFRRPISFIIEQYLNRTLKIFDYNITPHTHVFNDFKLKKIKIELIENFPLIKKNRDLELNDYIDRSNIICYTGTVYEYSNQIQLAKAIQKIDNINYEIAGYINDTQLNALKNILPDKFKFHGRLTVEELSNFYKNSTIGYVLYDYKLNLGDKLGSFGTNKMFEYMEEGLPFICTDYFLWKEICEKYNCGIYIQPGDIEGLKDAISFLINNKEEAYIMGQNGKKAVLNDLNWGIVEKKYINVFKKI